MAAQTVSMAISALIADSTSPAPVITVTGFESRPELAPYTLSMVMSLDAQFTNPFYVKGLAAESGTFTIDSLLPEHTIVYFRARLIDRFSNVVAETNAHYPVRSWLRLIRQPAILNTRNPRFDWSSPAITVPPGLWQYDLTVMFKETGRPAFFRAGLQDTTFQIPAADSLEANASYTWEVHARAQNGPERDQVTVVSSTTFVITSTGAPTFTLFYNNFPNPFGRGQLSTRTCFWFDLAHAAKVTLTIYDVRLRLVRHIIPGPIGDGTLAVNTYGRQNGCDDRLTWDGKDDSGRYVPPGVYFAVFDGDRTHSSKKMLFKGP